jgi:sugar phosphate isomerase/epimerase
VLIGGRAHTVAEAEFIAQAGFPFAELSIRTPQEFNRDAYSFRRLQDRFGIFYVAHGPEEVNTWEPEKLRADFLPLVSSLLDCATELAITVFTLHFWLDRRFVADDIAAEKIEILKAMTGHAERRGIKLCIENLSERVSDFSPVFAAIAGLGMTLDVGHGELLTARNTAYEFAAGWPERIWHVHLHDNRGGDTVADDLHLPLGEGVIDFTSILDCLRKQGYDRTMTLEIPPAALTSGKKIIEQAWQKEMPAA